MTSSNKLQITRKIKAALKKIVSFNVDFLIDKSDGIIGFSSRKAEISKIIDDSNLLFKKIDIDYDFIKEKSEGSLNRALHALHNMILSLDAMDAFITKQNKQIFLSPNDRGYERIDVTKNSDEITKQFDLFHSEFDVHITPLARQIELEEEIQDLSAGKELEGIEQYTSLFQSRINNYRDTSDWWLIAIIGTFIFSLYWIFQSMSKPTEFKNDDLFLFLDHVALRVLLFSFLGYAIYFLTKSYRLNKNQQVIYEDKKTALECYAFFEKANRSDQELHRAVLLQVTDAIFKTHSNGYVDKQQEPSPSPVDAVNLMNAVKSLVKIEK